MGVLIWKNLKDLLKSKKKNLLLLGCPIVVFILLTRIYSETLSKQFVQPVIIGVVDLDQSVFSKLLLDHYEKNTVFTEFITLVSGTKSEIEKAFSDGVLDAKIEIPKDFANQLIHLNHEQIKVDIRSNDPMKAIIIKNILLGYERYIQAVEQDVSLLYEIMENEDFHTQEISVANTEISYELIMTAMERNQFFEYTGLMDIPSTSSLGYFIIAMITLLIMYFGLYVGLDLLKERHQQTFQRLEVMGYRRLTLLGGKLISHGIYLFSITCIWLIIFSEIVALNLHIKLLLILLVGIFFSISFSIFIATLFQSEETILLVGNIFYFLWAIVGGNIIPLQFMPENVIMFSKLTPNYWLIKGLLYVQQEIKSWLPWIIIVGFSVLAIFLIVLAERNYESMGESL